MANRHGDFIWYELMSADADTAQAFYGELTGWRFSDSGQPGRDYRIVNAGEEPVGGLLQLTREQREHGAQPNWMGYICVDDVEKSLAAIGADGGTVMMPAMAIPGAGTLAMVCDPQGVPFYIMHPTGGEESRAFSTDTSAIGHCAWNQLMTTDQRAAPAFYGNQFGWRKSGEMDMGEMGSYEFLNHRADIGAVMTCPPDVRPNWLYFFRVTDIDTAATTITRLGGTLTMPPGQIPESDEYYLIAVDPEGAAFGLIGSK
ncbi:MULTISPECIES: VOC family protein [unclassified Microbulbifer]|uniref:VOC family protein n=1 Tax=unclassified Microbulbifer TaxID=2619833 RepID=UPI0027E4E86F|nr:MULTISPECIES: VOC family protein [unclassified Microbulbifer]